MVFSSVEMFFQSESKIRVAWIYWMVRRFAIVNIALSAVVSATARHPANNNNNHFTNYWSSDKGKILQQTFRHVYDFNWRVFFSYLKNLHFFRARCKRIRIFFLFVVSQCSYLRARSQTRCTKNKNRDKQIKIEVQIIIIVIMISLLGRWCARALARLTLLEKKKKTVNKWMCRSTWAIFLPFSWNISIQ